jgi:hypothetical protein
VCLIFIISYFRPNYAIDYRKLVALPVDIKRVRRPNVAFIRYVHTLTAMPRLTNRGFDTATHDDYDHSVI